MTNDEIIEMARQAHYELVTKHYVGHLGQLDAWTMLLLEIFAKLVAAKEREACARVCETLWNTPPNGMATEEEAYGKECATAIRARGNN